MTEDLSFVSTADLVTEITKRYGAALVVLEKAPVDSERLTEYSYSGGVSACLGLALRAQQELLRLASIGQREAEDKEGA